MNAHQFKINPLLFFEAFDFKLNINTVAIKNNFETEI